jgi:hypothetical protein
MPAARRFTAARPSASRQQLRMSLLEGLMHAPDARKLRSGVAVFAVVASSGCYGYFNSAPETIQPGEQVRVVLSDGVRHRIASAAMQRESMLEGDLVGLTPDSAALAVWIGQSFRGTQFETAHQTVTLPREQIAIFQRRELSEWRTVAVTGALLGLAIALIREVGFKEDPNPGRTEAIPPPPPSGGGVQFRGGLGLRWFPIR